MNSGATAVIAHGRASVAAPASNVLDNKSLPFTRELQPPPKPQRVFSRSGKNFKLSSTTLLSRKNLEPGRLEMDTHLVMASGVASSTDRLVRMLKKDCLLFYCPEQEELARRVSEASGGKVQLGEISWKNFADGFPNLFVKDATHMHNRHVGFLASFSNPSTIFEQISIIYALPRMFVGSFTLVLPFFPTGTAERVEAEGEVATAFTMARILSNIPLSRGGPTSVVIFDIHALQERFYFGDTVLPLFESGIPLVRAALAELPDADNVTVAYPDEGAWKRFHYQFGDYPEVICTKVRDGDKRIVRLKEGEPKGRHIVIVDDLVQSGGTLIECQRLLATLGAKHVSAYVTHGVFPKNSFERFVSEGEGGAMTGFKNFWITDSCPQTAKHVGGRPPFKVLSLANIIADALQI